jgi:hypothetical protein
MAWVRTETLNRSPPSNLPLNRFKIQIGSDADDVARLLESVCGIQLSSTSTRKTRGVVAKTTQPASSNPPCCEMRAPPRCVSSHTPMELENQWPQSEVAASTTFCTVIPKCS